MTFLQKLDYLMALKHLNKHSLSQQSSIPYTTIDGWYKKGYERAKLPTVQRLAEFFDVSLDYFLDDSIVDEHYGKTNGFSVGYHEMQHIKKYRQLDERGKGAVDALLNFEFAQANAVATPSTVEMIVYTYPAAAGVPLYADNDYEQIEFPEDDVPKGANFGIRISGDSMLPTIPDDTIVFVRKTPTLQNDQIGIFMLDDSAICKRFFQRGKTLELRSDNPAYPPITVKDYERFGIIGRVLGYK